MLPKSLAYPLFIPKTMARLMSSTVCKENDQTTASKLLVARIYWQVYVGFFNPPAIVRG